ncbi:BTAD domain-containing putative transcriptional regulator [Streptomyces sp. ICBB 8177]|uniref:AfsR/SARP family transcriptional regulator n=1 Tax=Streptomyces sp. ICBB 8177 TaxID=563922 RepID=UPI000D67B8E6|nr:BTAD domain-containing putative transcriptional regulator [Streptomyces sp. ICBB 8177]PWI44839.1 SARP family transcriptional regulator [Streptomyces sp. ICBB 8177]
MEYCILGHLEVFRAGTAVPLGGPRERAVLALLLLEANHVIPVDRLIDAVWGEDPPATARGQIHICISNLRRRITLSGPDPIETRNPGYRIRVEPGTLDLHRFEQQVAEGRAAMTGSRPARAVTELRSALALWRGPALADVDSRLVRLGAARLDERRLTVLGECLECSLLSGEHRELIGELQSLVVEHPLQEHFKALLMTALYRAGRQAEALEEYRRARHVLMDELGIEPGEELRRLHQSMLAGEFTPAPPGAVPPSHGPAPASAAEPAARQHAPTSDVASSRTPEAPSQSLAALPTGASAVTSAPGATTDPVAEAVTEGTGAEPPTPETGLTTHAWPQARTPSLLPADIPDFTGRRETIELILRQVGGKGDGGTEHAVRVCVVVGQGGAGKTTLAVHVAHLLAQDFPDGQLYAHLRTGDRPASPADILERFLRVLGVSGPALPKGLEERAELFRDLVSGRRMLIVLDDAMTERQVAALLPGTAGSSVIVTSRRRLTGLPSAARVEIGALSDGGAAELLSRIVGEERIGAEPEDVAELSRLCGNLPLALRICAARLAARPHWSVADLVDRLVDESRRLDELNHGELEVRASISLTYDGLSDDARLLFRRLALLDVPSFAHWVGAPLLEVDAPRAQEALEVLAEAYLINAKPGPGGHVRYSFHDMMRPFARERLVEEDAGERRGALERWLGALLSLTGEAHRRQYAGDYLELRSPASRWQLPRRLVDRLMANPLGWYEQERTSLVAAVRQAAAGGLVDHAWDLALSSVTLFEANSYFDDWRDTHEVALKAACRAGDRRGEAAMRYSLGSLHSFEHASDRAMRQFEQAYALYRRMDDHHGAALVARNMAYQDWLKGDVTSAMGRWEEALGVFQVTGDRVAEAHVLQRMARVRQDCGEPDAALRLLERAGEICEEVGNERVAAQVRNRLGELCLGGGDLDGARRAYEAVLESVRAAGDKVGQCYALLGLATVEMRSGGHGAATQTLTEALRLAVKEGARMAESRITLALAEACMVARPEAAASHAEHALRGFEAIGATLFRARALGVRGRIRAQGGDPEAARDDWRAAKGMLSGLRLDQGAMALVGELNRRLAALPGEAAGEAGTLTRADEMSCADQVV